MTTELTSLNNQRYLDLSLPEHMDAACAVNINLELKKHANYEYTVWEHFNVATRGWVLFSSLQLDVEGWVVLRT